MACVCVKIDGQVVHLNVARRNAIIPCAFCGEISTKQCDYPVAAGKTCDEHMCDRCSVLVGENLDHCLGHSRVGKRYRVISSGRHNGHTMLLLAWRKRPKYQGARELVWKYAAQCSCLSSGDLESFQLKTLDLTQEVA